MGKVALASERYGLADRRHERSEEARRSCSGEVAIRGDLELLRPGCKNDGSGMTSGFYIGRYGGSRCIIMSADLGRLRVHVDTRIHVKGATIKAVG